MTTDGMELAVRLVGEVAVTHRDRVVHPRVVGGRRCDIVLGYLAVNRHREVTLEELADVLWPALRPQSWNSAVRGVLSRVRDALEMAGMPPDTVRSRAGNVRLTLPDGSVTDLEFARGCCDPSPDDTVTVQDARTALRLLDGPVLRDVEGGWADELRAEADALRVRAHEVNAEGSLRLAEYEAAISSAERLIAIDPLRESAYRTAIRGHMGLGERGRALQVAANCRQVLSHELGVAPSAATEELFLAVLRGDTPSGPPRSAGVIGRATELTAISDAVARASRGAGQVVIISGEAGSGKSTVAHAAMDQARAAGADVLFGRCSEEAVVPFEPLVEAIGDDLDAAGADVARERLRDTGAGIFHLIPKAAHRFPDVTPEPPLHDDRATITTAVLEWLTTSTRRGPTVLVIEDLHWASPATSAVIRYLIHASSRSRLCVIATVRDEFLDDTEVRSTLAGAERSTGLRRIRLAGLSVAEVGAIIEASGAALDPVTLVERTRGLPLFVESLIASHLSGSGESLPSSIAESVAQRERLLTGDAREVLQLCSVVGMVAPRIVLRTVTAALTDHAFAEALDDLVRQRLIIDSAEGTTVVLRHPLVQEAVYAEIAGTRRAELHSRVARALTDLGEVGVPEEYARLAHHLSRGRDADRARAVSYWWRAGTSAMTLGAYEDSVAFYRSAERRLIPRGDSADRCRLWVDLGRAQRKARDPGFRATLLGATDMARRLGDVDLQVTATLANDLQGILYVHLHSDSERIADLYDALDALEKVGRGNSGDAARLLSQLAIELIWVSDHTTRQTLLVRAIGAARAAGDRRALVTALSAVVVALRVPQCAAFRRQSYDELMELLAGSPDRRIDPLVAVWIARQQIEYGDLQAANRTAAVLTDAQVSRDPELTWLASYLRFAIDLAAGRLDRCDGRLADMLDIPSPPLESYTFGRLLGPVVALRTLRGDMSEVADARAALTERFDIVDTYRACLATALVDVGDADAAADLVAWYDRPRIEKIPVNNIWLATIATIGRVAAQVGNTEVCDVAYEILSAHPDENTISWASVYGTVHHHLGELSIALDEFDRAADHLDDARVAHRERGFDGWYAETLYLVALLEQRRDGRASEKSLDRARRAADEVGATAVRRRIDALTG
ncbi:AAA family ATPase [Williamsia herbipolensis]|uniref:AAA family ATPase n=1 Tax=Williamsia herbipolensis TaxID=1603258 RepID=A0AAU4K7L8_9NOCA|nr:AAA family ATPase [Williamsia herbipolensis]